MSNWIAKLYRRLREPKKKCQFCRRTLRSKRATALGYGAVCGRRNQDVLSRLELERQGQMNIFEEKQSALINAQKGIAE